jgi:hypothetical protein
MTVAKKNTQKIRLGDKIVWYLGGSNSTEPTIGIVVGIGFGTRIDVRLFPSGTDIVPAKLGVPHAGDATAREDDLRRNGSWETLDEYEYRQEERDEEESLRRLKKENEMEPVGAGS